MRFYLLRKKIFVYFKFICTRSIDYTDNHSWCFNSRKTTDVDSNKWAWKKRKAKRVCKKSDVLFKFLPDSDCPRGNFLSEYRRARIGGWNRAFSLHPRATITDKDALLKLRRRLVGPFENENPAGSTFLWKRIPR